MPSNKPTPILFISLDNTVRLGPPEHPINSPADVELYPGVLPLLQDYKSKGWRLVGVCHYGDIALGKLDESTANRIMQETNRLCANLFDVLMYCSHHPEAVGDTKEETLELSECFCRQPMPGLIFNAIYGMSQQYDEYYRPWTCLYVGDFDTPSNWQVADYAGIKFMDAKEWRKKSTA